MSHPIQAPVRSDGDLVPTGDWSGPDHLAAAAGVDAGVPTEMLLRALAELRVARGHAGADASGDLASDRAQLEDALQGELGRRRLQRQQADIRDAAEREPLRARALNLLRLSALTPSRLAGRLDVTVETTSRLLRTLSDDGLVEKYPDPHDARKRHYALTTEGYLALSDYLSLGETTPDERAQAAADDRQQIEEQLRAALTEAILERRRTDALDAAIERFEGIVAEAEFAGLYDLAVEAMGQLSVTLRQTERTQEIAAVHAELATIAAGRDEDYRGAAIATADAYLNYERGRLPESRGGLTLPARTDRLIAARWKWTDLAADPPVHGSDERLAWTLIGLADNLRQATHYGAALHTAAQARRAFGQTDRYGHARCAYIEGFTHRLAGDLDAAERALREATALADDEGYQRFSSESLAQLGEVNRQRGALDRAREQLSTSLATAHRLELTDTVAFAHLALGAVETQAERESEATRHLDEAAARFAHLRDDEGLALALRRKAVLRRHSGQVDPETTALVDQAFRAYGSASSPAGQIQAIIELGELRRAGGLGLEPVANLLVAEVVPHIEAVSVDAFAPTLLRGFARHTADERLTAITAAVLERQRQPVVGSADDVDLQALLQRQAPNDALDLADVEITLQFEMAAETRHETERSIAADAREPVGA